MLQRLRSLFSAIITTEEKISCYHCGEKSGRSRTVYVIFENTRQPVCCYGCAAVLKAVEELGIHDEYHASKIITS